jgi:hypothetical protein
MKDTLPSLRAASPWYLDFEMTAFLVTGNRELLHGTLQRPPPGAASTASGSGEGLKERREAAGPRPVLFMPRIYAAFQETEMHADEFLRPDTT